MPQESDGKEQVSWSLLDGVVLLALVQEREPLHGYGLTTVVERRLGPACGFTRQGVYRALGRLERQGLVSTPVVPASGHGRRGARKRGYVATERAGAALAAWMDSPIAREPVLADIQTRIAMSREEDAPKLLRALDAHEQQCLDLLRRAEETEVSTGSWRALTMNLARAAAQESVRGKLSWMTMARQWIEEFTAERYSGPS